MKITRTGLNTIQPVRFKILLESESDMDMVWYISTFLEKEYEECKGRTCSPEYKENLCIVLREFRQMKKVIKEVNPLYSIEK